jgi:hypothetical protein
MLLESKPPGNGQQGAVTGFRAAAVFENAPSQVTRKLVTLGYFGALTNRVNLLS